MFSTVVFSVPGTSPAHLLPVRLSVCAWVRMHTCPQRGLSRPGRGCPRCAPGPSHAPAATGACAHVPSASRWVPWPSTAQPVGRQVQQPSVATWWGRSPFSSSSPSSLGLAAVCLSPWWTTGSAGPSLKATGPGGVGGVDSPSNSTVYVRSFQAGSTWGSPSPSQGKIPSLTPPTIAVWSEEHPPVTLQSCSAALGVPFRRLWPHRGRGANRACSVCADVCSWGSPGVSRLQGADGLPGRPLNAARVRTPGQAGFSLRWRLRRLETGIRVRPRVWNAKEAWGSRPSDPGI